MDTQIKNKNILVTGGAGFVGSNLAKELNKKNKVYIIDNYFTGNISNHIKGIKYFKAETIDILKIFKNIKLDYIFHFGEYSRVEQSLYEIDKVIDYNLRPLYEIIKLAEKNKAKLIYSGSSTKFGIYFPGDIQSPYAWSKKINTDFINHYSNWKKIDYAIVYFYNVYGPNEIRIGKYATVIGKFLNLKKTGKKSVPVTLPGTQKRNFTHIYDIVSGLQLVALYGNGDDYCIGSDEEFSIIQVAKMLKMKISYTKSKQGNRKESRINKTKLKKLGWVAKNKLHNYLIESM